MRTFAAPVQDPTDRRRAASLAVGAVAGCALLAVVDPSEPGRYPVCPTAALLGLDCPACGTLRGVHALARGRPLAALDHNVLLAVAVPVALLVWWQLVRRAAGRPAAEPSWPRWATPVAIFVAAVFGIVRNVPFEPFRVLAAGA